MACKSMAAGSPPAPSRKTARQRRAGALRDARRSLIVEAAKTVFAARGLEGASMRAIAAEAGCSTGAVYPYFHGKEEIYASLLAASLEALTAAVAAGMAGTAEPTDAARHGLQAFFDYYRTRADELTLGLYLFGGIRPAGLNAEQDKALNARLKAVTGLIEAKLGETRPGEASPANDPRARAVSAMAQAIGLLILERTGRMKLFARPADDLFADYLARL